MSEADMRADSWERGYEIGWKDATEVCRLKEGKPTMGELNHLAQCIATWRESKGFQTPQFHEGDALLGKLMLVVTEIAEAAEAVRHQDFENYKEEIADTFIRLLDLCGTQGIDPKEIVMKKMEVNLERPHLHGKKTNL